MKRNKKLNDGCVKIFTFLKLLYDNEAEYNKVLEIFKDEIKETSKGNVQVTLNRYINTLKVFGIKIKKSKTKYKLQSSLCSINLTNSDLKAISILASYIHKLPDNKTITPVKNFMKELELRMKSSDKNTLNRLFGNNDENYNFAFYYTNMREQILQCEKICTARYLINIVYQRNDEKQQSKGYIKELIYGCKTVSIIIYDSGKHINIEIPIHNILSIEYLPNIANNIEVPTTVVYKLKNRLAKTYKIKENEYSDGYDAEGNLIIVNKSESIDSLFHRLLRYTYNCEVISPKNIRDEMIKLLNDTINTYETTTDTTSQGE